LSFSFLICCGCKQKQPQQDWAAYYADARHRKEIHDKSAAGMVERGLQATATSDPLLHYKFLLLKAGLTVAKCGDPNAAKAMLATVPAEFVKHSDLEAERKYIQAFAAGCAKDYRKAEGLLLESENLANQNRPELTASIASLSAWLEHGQNNPRQEEEDYVASIDLARQFHSPVEASSLNSLALLYLKAGRYKDAIERFLASVEAARKWHDRWVEEVALGNLGQVYSDLGDFANAEDYSKPAAEIAAQIDEPVDEEAWLITLGHSYQSDARQLNSEAETAYAKAVPIANALHDNNAAGQCFSNLAQLALKKSDIQKAKNYVQKVEELHPTGDLAFYLTLDQADIAQAQNDSVTAEYLLLSAAKASPQPPVLLLWRFQTNLGRLYAAQGKDDLAEQWFSTAMKTAENQFARIPPGDPRMTFLDSAPFYSAYISFLLARNKTNEALAVAELGRARTLAETSGKRTPQKALSDIKRVQQRLVPEKEVVLAYFLTDDKSYLWAITHKEIQYFSLPSQKDLYEKIRAYNKGIQDLAKLGDSTNGSSLYATLVAPAAKLIPAGALVTVIPNRYLYHLDFDTLVVSAPAPHYWIEDVNIQICSALTLIANSRPEKIPPARQMLLIGAPVQAKDGPPVLRHAPEEVERVAGHFPSDQKLVIQGKEAVPEAYLDRMPGRFRFIHFAAHGIASQNRPLESAIILSPDSAGRYKLVAPDIIKLRIRADLVIISSCESAGTRTYDAEGLVGLGWAFMRAGAHRVVAGLWDVDDASTPGLMDEFYTELRKGRHPADALRLAKLSMLHSSDHSQPYYWAALQLYTGS
jgi:CHAT domain-containing protein